MQLRRLVDRPIIEPSTHPSIGHNIQGPSLLRVPEWLPDAPGRYLLYFADHKGDHLRLAYADDPTGPWTVVPGGALHLVDSHFLTEPPPATDEERHTWVPTTRPKACVLMWPRPTSPRPTSG